LVAGDGRLRRSGVVITEDHPKVTRLNSHMVIFASGVQECAEDLRKAISAAIDDEMDIDEVAGLVEQHSRHIHANFMACFPDALAAMGPDATTMAILLGFYCPLTDRCGFVEYSHATDFIPEYHVDAIAKCRGIEQDQALAYLLKVFNPTVPADSLRKTFQYVTDLQPAVGGQITIFLIDKTGVHTPKEVN